MSTVFALTTLYSKVKQVFVDEVLDAKFSFGKREPTKQVNQGPGRANRVVFVPGIDGSVGKYDAAREPGRNPRPIMSLMETAQIYIWAYDPSGPNDEEKQYEAVRLLHDWVVLALYRAGRGWISLSNPKWVDDKVERRFGAEMVVTVEVRSPIPDTPWQVVEPPVEEETTSEFVLEPEE